MSQVSILFVVIIAAVLLSGCKIAIINVEGGGVDVKGGLLGKSTDCQAGHVCVIDVEEKHPHYFEATPYDGWIFSHWEKGDRFLCGGNRYYICTLSFRSFNEETAYKIIESAATMNVMPIFRPAPDTMLIDGKEWYQPYLFKGLSWADINAVCPSGVCDGILNGQDMTGWTWASVKDMNEFFNYYLGSERLGPGPDQVVLGLSGNEALPDRLFKHKWVPTAQYYGYWEVSGLTKNGLNTDPDKAWSARWVDESRIAAFEIDIGIRISTNDESTKDDDSFFGAWFYRMP